MSHDMFGDLVSRTPSIRSRRAPLVVVSVVTHALVVLAIATCLFTALLEAGWEWVYQDFEPDWVLGNNFSLEFGISPAWYILALGLLIALIGAWRQAPHLTRESKAG